MIKSGFLVVKTFEQLYKELASRYNLTIDFYGIPRIDQNPKDSRIKYRGIDREALSPYENSNLLAERRLNELKPYIDCEEEILESGFLSSYKDVLEIYNCLGDVKPCYEIVWVRVAGSEEVAPKQWTSIGFEPSYFYSDHFSASCDCMFFPRWHGTDEDGCLFNNYFSKLNKFGLFNDPKTAKEFLEYYLSFDWTERGDYWITEVFLGSK